ncbi:MAG: hypothetical protein KJ006_05305 [Thermoleophilia bacterium]|nr:hypothetical protein [Thermoleophilia bacterium]
MKRLIVLAGTVLLALAMAVLAVPGQSVAAKKKTLVVCKHGCKYRTIQAAVDASGRNATIKVRPAVYKEGVIVEGKKHDGLTITGTRKITPKLAERLEVAKKAPPVAVLNGKNAKSPTGLAQNGIEAIDVKNITMKNMWAKNYATNGFFARDSHPADDRPLSKIRCRGYLMKNLVASFNRAYGLYGFGCIGGHMTRSRSWGSGDSAFYVGATPTQTKNPVWSKLDHLDGHESVLGFSGTNAKYVKITKSAFYNNGIGLVPNTLDSEPYMPAASGKIVNNDIFWNNFNYFLPASRVETISNGIGTIGGLTVQFPIGTGIVLLGADGWEIEGNRIFGHNMWGAALVSNPIVEAISQDNVLAGNEMGRGGTDPNRWDFFADGSGTGNCFADNSSSVFDEGSIVDPGLDVYPDCPAPGSSGTGTFIGDGGQFGKMVGYATTDPSYAQECPWARHPHPRFKGYEELVVTPGPDCDA